MPEITGDLNELMAWLERNVPSLMQSRENWQVIINADQGGRLCYEIKKTGEILPARKRRLEERIR